MDEHPLHCCIMEKPAPDAVVKLFFEEGPPRDGIWTGKEWQVERKRVAPVSWRPPHGKEMTHAYRPS
jgi:hypothetical protein